MQRLNLAVVTNRRFSKRDFDRYGVEVLSEYFNVWVLDCSLVKKSANSLVNKSDEKCDAIFEQHVIFSDLKSFVQHLENNSTLFYVDLLGESSLENIRIRRTLHAKNASRIKLRIGEIPSLDVSETAVAKLKSAAMRGDFFQKLYRYLVARIFSRVLEPKVDIAVFSGEICKKRYPDLASDIIWAHSIDYQIFRNCQQCDNAVISEKCYAVFLDQNAPSHPDYSFHGNKPPVTEPAYYRALNEYFDDFERQTGIEVVIAVHPRSPVDYDKCWSGRKTVLGNTPELVKDSTLVFAHYSTAISFAVLWRKPIVQLTTNEYENSYRWDRFQAFSDLLNLTVVNTDNYEAGLVADESLFEVDEAAYDEYEKMFLKSRYAESKDLWNIVAENIESYASSSL